MATYHTPVTTHAANDVFSSSEYNNIGDSLNYLLAGIHASGKYDKGSDITTSSTSFGAIDSTNLAKTVTLVGTKAMLIFRGAMLESGGGNRVDLDVTANGTRWHSTGTEGTISATLSGSTTPMCMVVLIDGLTPGSNTFQVHWKVSAFTGVLRAGSGSAGQDNIPAFDVVGW